MPRDLTTALALAVPLVFPAEGCELHSYLDELPTVPVWTIGHGTRWVDGKPVCAGMTCTMMEADAWAGQDLRLDATEVLAAVHVPLTDHQLAACTSLSYNIGIGRFAHSDVAAALNAGHYRIAADRFLEWDHAGGVRVAGLDTRRAAERAMFLVGMAPAA